MEKDTQGSRSPTPQLNELIKLATAGEMISRVEGSLRALEHDRQKEIEEAKVEVAEVSAPGKVTTPTQNQEEGFSNKVPIEKRLPKRL